MGGCAVIEHYSTSLVEPGRRRDFWNELMEDTYQGVVVDPFSTRFNADLSRWRMGDVTMIWPRSAAAAVARRSANHLNSQKVVLHVVHAGECTLAQRGRTATLRTGDFVVCAAEENYRFDVAGKHQMLVVEMDRALIAPQVPQLDDMIATCISGAMAPTRLLHNFLLSLWREGSVNLDESMSETYSGILANLLATSLQVRPSAQTQLCHPLFGRMKGIVEVRLFDPELSTASLASELGVSVRRLQIAVAEAGTTPIGYITKRRMESAADRLLMEPSTPITDICYSTGYSDCAYFSRRFHAHFGMSPTEYRNRH
jgi:AraC family transcriptional regulator, positive regulator of tynA and feaB